MSKPAIDHREYFNNRIETRMRESLQQGRQLISTSGEVVGQINGLTVLQIGQSQLRPSLAADGDAPMSAKKAWCRSTVRRNWPVRFTTRADDPGRLSGRKIRGRISRSPSRRSSPLNRITAASTATAPRRPSFTRCSPVFRAFPFARAWPSPAPSTRPVKSRPSAA